MILFLQIPNYWDTLISCDSIGHEFVSINLIVATQHRLDLAPGKTNSYYYKGFIEYILQQILLLQTSRKG